MKSIFASKLYRASSRKGRIQAALIAPSNLALVQQLAENLEDKYKTPENLGVEPEKEEDEDLDLSEFASDEKVDPKKDLMTMNDLSKHTPSHTSSHSSAPKAPNSSESDSEPKEPLDKPSTDELMPESPANEKPEEPAEASTKIKATTLDELNALKATLNARQDLSGVSRIAEKENEIWIYYKDEINLNNIMTDVIEYLMNNGYEHFEFNRLARSDNAIVFVSVLETF